MLMIAELKTLLLEILESAFQSGDVHATQQLGVKRHDPPTGSCHF